MILWIIGISSGLVALYFAHVVLHKWTLYKIGKEATQYIEDNSKIWAMDKKHKKGNLKRTYSDAQFNKIVKRALG